MFSDKVLNFYSNINLIGKLPKGVSVMNPYLDSQVMDYVQSFYYKYYDDNNQRTMIMGINPGRFGAGITGIPFTDPVQLEEQCNIKNNFDKKTELSSIYIYQMIDAYGGIKNFYKKFYISSISPLGFVKSGKNMNYYDTKELQDNLRKFILKSVQTQVDFGLNRNVCFCLGQGKNYAFFKEINKEYNYFQKIIPLAHPRYILQYKRKFLNDYITEYLQELSK